MTTTNTMNNIKKLIQKNCFSIQLWHHTLVFPHPDVYFPFASLSQHKRITSSQLY
jgi:hypothetical protein